MDLADFNILRLLRSQLGLSVLSYFSSRARLQLFTHLMKDCYPQPDTNYVYKCKSFFS